MKKKLYFLGVFLVMLSTSLELSAQSNKLIVGQIISKEDLSALPNVVCKTFNKNKEMLDYCITNNKGSFSFKSEAEAKYIEFSLLGYKKLEKEFVNWLKEPLVKMESTTIDLKEVVVKVSPIKKSNDTLTYNVIAFQDKQDKYIDDILKKLPGISVSETGSISYQGKPISKLYLEGQDLLGNSYNQATRSLPVDAVSQIEILENNQHIKALKNKVFTDKAALNIKLKSSYKVRPFGEISAGIGIKPNIWDNNLFLTQVNSKNQVMLTYKMNNSGKDLSEYTSEHIDFSDIYSYEPLPRNVLQSSGMRFVPISQERYLNNKSNYLALNILSKLTDNSNLRTNIMFYTDRNTKLDSTINYYAGINPISLIETNKKINKIKSFVPSLKYELNSERLYILNEFKTVFSNSTQSSSIINNYNKKIEEEIINKPIYLQNTLNITNNTGNKVYNINSFTRYFDQKESLDVNNYSNPSSINIKDGEIGFKRFFTKNRISTILPFLGQDLDLGLDLVYEKDNYSNSNLSAINLNSKNKAVKNTIKIGFSPKYYLNYSSNGKISFQIPIRLEKLQLSVEEQEINKSYIICSPSFQISHSITNSLDLRFSSSYNSNETTNRYYSDEAIYHNYRTIYYSLNDISLSKTLNLTSNISYRNLAEMIFCNITASFTNINNPYYYDYNYKENITEAKPKWERNYSNLLFINGSVDKTITSASLSIKLEMNYSRNDYLMSQFGKKLTNTSNILTETLTTSFYKLAWIKFLYTHTGNIAWQDKDKRNLSRLRSMHNDMKIFVFPNPKINFSIALNHNIIEIEKNRFDKNLFVDIKAHYSPLKRIEFSLQMNNLLDRKSYSISSIIGPNYQYYYLPLRGREYLVSCMFKL